jgi:hypothetical protein
MRNTTLVLGALGALTLVVTPPASAKPGFRVQRVTHVTSPLNGYGRGRGAPTMSGQQLRLRVNGAFRRGLPKGSKVVGMGFHGKTIGHHSGAKVQSAWRDIPATKLNNSSYKLTVFTDHPKARTSHVGVFYMDVKHKDGKTQRYYGKTKAGAGFGKGHFTFDSYGTAQLLKNTKASYGKSGSRRAPSVDVDRTTSRSGVAPGSPGVHKGFGAYYQIK